MAVAVNASACAPFSETASPALAFSSAASRAAADEAGPGDAARAGTTLRGTLNLGYFPNVTHAPALVGMAEGFFAIQLGPDVDLNTFTFGSGTDAIEAVLTGALDLAFIGPNPAIIAHHRSGGEAVRIVSGSTSGGARLVVRPDITSVDDLRGTTLASPSLGSTQDVALRSWLLGNNLATDLDGGGDVSILPQQNATTLEAFVGGLIDGAWVPEPWATRLVDEGGGTVLVDEADLWPETGGRFVTTHLIVRTEFLTEHPDLVKAVIAGLVDAIDMIDADPTAAEADVVSQIEAISGSAPAASVISRSLANLQFGLDPIATSLVRSAADARSVGLLDAVDLTGIYDLSLLNEILAERGRAPVSGP